MIIQPNPTDGMTDEQKKAYYAQKTISRDIPIVINPQSGMIGREVNDFTSGEKSDVKQASDLLE